MATLAAWLKKYWRVFAALSAIGAFLSGVGTFGTWIEHFWNKPQVVVQPLTYEPWSEFAQYVAARQIYLKEVSAEQPRLAKVGLAPIGMGSQPPTWKRTYMFDFAYAVDHIVQGDHGEVLKKDTFHVSCVGRWHLPVCQTTAEHRERNHIHYADWLTYPPKDR
jgi:hypothetical protein